MGGGVRQSIERESERSRPGAEVEAAARQLHGGSMQDGPVVAGALINCAFAEPEQTASTWDALARGVLGTPDEGRPIVPPPVRPTAPQSTLWPELWRLIDDLGGGPSSGEVTLRTAALGAHTGPDFAVRLEAACLAFPGVPAAVALGYPRQFGLAELAACPPGSLGRDFHSQIVDNGFDLEVLDREALGLAGLSPVHACLNARALQSHDLWHLVGGYELTGLHEIGISAFQLAQFGHGYSAMFLAMIMARTVQDPGGAGFLLELVARAWRHGRRTPPLVAVDWPSVWDVPVEAARERLGVAAFDSPFPANLFEQLRAAAA